MPVQLPIELHGELELTRIIRRRCLARIDKQRANGRDVVLIGNIEHIHNEVGTKSLGEVDTFGNAQIAECRPGRYTCIASKVAVKLQEGRDRSGRDEAINARLLEYSCRRIFRTVDGSTSGIDR